MIATAALIVAGLLLAGWNYWLTNRLQQILNRADRQQDVIDRRLALVPSKSAPRTDGSDTQPGPLFTRLTAPEVVALPTEDVTMTGADDLLEQPARRKHAAPKPARKEARA